MLSEWWSDVRYRFRAVVHRADVERELAAEIQDHLQREAESDRLAGLSPAEAMRHARLAFGGVEAIKEQSRGVRGISALDTTAQVLHQAWRSLRRRRGLVGGVTVALALGVGANAAMFHVVDRLLLSAPPYVYDPSRIGRVYFSWQLGPGDAGLQGFSPDVHVFMPYARYLDLVRWTKAFDDAAVFADAEDDVPVGSGQTTEPVRVAAVSARFFSFFNATPSVGRYFTEADDRPPEGSAVAVLGNAFWRSQYGGRPDVIGKRVLVDRREYTIIGVAPRDFIGVGDVDEVWQDPSSGYGKPPAVFVPVTTFAATYMYGQGFCDYTGYCAKFLQMIVRRRAGVSPETASQDMNNAFQRSYIAQRTDAEARNAYEWKRIFPPIEIAKPEATVGPLLPARGPMVSKTTRVATWVAAVAAIVFAVACANVAGLLLANARERRAEIGLRLALGVSQRRLAAQLLTECLMLAVIGGVAALCIGGLGQALLTGVFLPGDTTPPLFDQPRTLVFAGLVALTAGLLISVAPMLQARRAAVLDAFKGASSAGRTAPTRGRGALLALQAALSVMLLVGAGLFVRSMQHVRGVHLGFDVEPLLYAQVDRRGTTFDSVGERQLAQRMVDAAVAQPGVTGAMRTFGGPFVIRGSYPLVLPGIGPVNQKGDFSVAATSPGYFELTGTRILRGRDFGTSDVAGAPRVAIVSQATADALWPGQDVLGKTVKIGSDTAPGITIVGVADNTIGRTLSDQQRFLYYLPLRQFDYDAGTLALGTVEVLIRVRGPTAGYETTLRRALQGVMPGAAYVSLRPLEDDLDMKIRSWRFGATLFVAFGALALIVAAIGLYSVIANEVATRRYELGVRVALGARMRHVLQLLTAECGLFAAAGTLIGAVIAFAAAPLVGPLLFAESARDPEVFTAAALTLVAAAAAAVAAPIARASRVDPGSALRAE